MIAVEAICLRRSHKAPLKCTNEARCMLVANGASDLFDAQVRALEELGGSIKPVIDDCMAETKTGLLLEQMLKMRLAQVEFARKTLKATRLSRCNRLEQFADAFLPQVWASSGICSDVSNGFVSRRRICSPGSDHGSAPT